MQMLAHEVQGWEEAVGPHIMAVLPGLTILSSPGRAQNECWAPRQSSLFSAVGQTRVLRHLCTLEFGTAWWKLVVQVTHAA